MEIPWELRRRGFKDSLRHDQRVREAMKKNLRELIAEESIITSDGTKKIRIPIRYLDQYRFKYGQPQQGVGQGGGQPGDVLGQGQGNQPGSGDQPGTEPGEHAFEVEVPLEELTRMMLEELALPWLEEKDERIETSESHEMKDIRRTGSFSNLDRRRSLKTNLLRNAARGTPKVGDWNNDDLRFKVWDIRKEIHTRAAVYMLMDSSGSMTTGKKVIAKTSFFWMVRFLRLKYKNVDTVFIAHDTEARMLDEKDFFGFSSAGGTRCSSAYKMALEHMPVHHPIASWNNYLLHFSDGDNESSDNGTCKELIEKLLVMCNMVGYAEISYNDYGWTGSTDSKLKAALRAIEHERFIPVTLNSQAGVYQALTDFLRR